jgi:hypothetical protein
MARSAKKAKASKAKVKAAKKTQPVHHEHHVDGCLCEVEVPEHLYTRDEDLPVTKGGVARR